MNEQLIGRLDWHKQSGLLPAIVQDADSGEVLMLGYMNREALEATLRDGLVTFFSRSRGQQWRKGETSGHVLELASIGTDCDADTLLVRARPRGPTCHLGTRSCFGDTLPSTRAASFLEELDALIGRRLEGDEPGSYTRQLAAAGPARVAQKVGEEGVEVALAAVGDDREALLGEAADLAFHLLVLLRVKGLSLSDLSATLAERHQRKLR